MFKLVVRLLVFLLKRYPIHVSEIVPSSRRLLHARIVPYHYQSPDTWDVELRDVIELW